MKGLTKLQLLSSAVIVVMLVGLSIISSLFDSALSLAFYFILVIIVIVFNAVMGVIESRLKNNSVYAEPVSKRASSIVINSVVIVWLSAIGFIVFIVLRTREESLAVVLSVGVIFFSAVIYGRYLQKRFSSYSLLSYGMSLFIALILMMVFFEFKR